MNRAKFLDTVKEIVCEDRKNKYGSPEDNFSDVAKLWNAYLGDIIFGAEDVAIMMVLFKVARLKGSEYKSLDSWLDIAGYAACGGEIALGGKNGRY